MAVNKLKCNGDCFNCKLPVEKCKGQPKNTKAAYKPMSKRKTRRKVGKVHAGPASIRPDSYVTSYRNNYER